MTDSLSDAERISDERLAELIELAQSESEDGCLTLDDGDMGQVAGCLRELKALRERHTGIEFLFTWIRAPNPMFGGVSPEQMILMRQGYKVIKFIREAQEDYEAGLHSSSPDAPVSAEPKGERPA